MSNFVSLRKLFICKNAQPGFTASKKSYFIVIKNNSSPIIFNDQTTTVVRHSCGVSLSGA